MVNQVLTTNQVMTMTQVPIPTTPEPQKPLPAPEHVTVEDGLAADRHLDITADVCPMTFVRTRLALDRMQPGQTLLVRLRGEEPTRNMPRTAAEQGHAVLSLSPGADGTQLLLLRRG